MNKPVDDKAAEKTLEQRLNEEVAAKAQEIKNSNAQRAEQNKNVAKPLFVQEKQTSSEKLE
jgi:hypothetical protein